MTATDELLAPHVVARVTGERIDDLEAWRAVGKGPRSFRLAGRTYYLRSEVEAWVARRSGGVA
jgi:hypothetical protein